MEPQTPSADPIAQYQHALALHQAGRLDEAAALYQERIDRDPADYRSLAGLGKIAAARDDDEHAVQLFARSLSICPNQPESLTNLGAALIRLHRLSEALASLDRAVALKPDLVQARNNRGTALLELGRPAEALASFDHAVALKPDLAVLHANRGRALQDLNRPGEALAAYERTITLQPDFAQAYNSRGNVLRDLGRPEDALASYEHAIALSPGTAEFHNNKGNVLGDLGRREAALASFDRAIALKPDYAEAFSNRGIAFKDMNRLEEALASLDHAILLQPDYAEAYGHRGVVLYNLRRLDAAFADYDRAIALDPGYTPTYWNLAMLKLLLGDFEEGWKHYEWRWQDWEKEFARHFPQPLWLGDAPLAGKTLLIHAEQGFGDFIQFCRYIPMAEALGAKVVVEVFPALIPLISSLKGSFSLVPTGQPLPAFDFHCPVMSLPLAFHTTVQSIPAHVPYLFADPERQALWRQRLGPKSRMRVGIAWSGNPAQKNNHNRSIPLRLLLPLLALPLEFHVLQKDIRPEDAAELARFANVRVHSANLGDFADTAALMQEMDLVVSVDTSVAHVAGAMNRPLWLLLPFNPDFRWFLDRSDSPWYPSATLFRQPAIGDWASVIADVGARLERLRASRSA